MIESSSDVDKTTPSVESKSRKFSIMASQVGGGDDDPGPSVKRSRLALSAVHEEFVVHDVTSTTRRRTNKSKAGDARPAIQSCSPPIPLT